MSTITSASSSEDLLTSTIKKYMELNDQNGILKDQIHEKESEIKQIQQEKSSLNQRIELYHLIINSKRSDKLEILQKASQIQDIQEFFVFTTNLIASPIGSLNQNQLENGNKETSSSSKSPILEELPLKERKVSVDSNESRKSRTNGRSRRHSVATSETSIKGSMAIDNLRTSTPTAPIPVSIQIAAAASRLPFNTNPPLTNQITQPRVSREMPFIHSQADIAHIQAQSSSSNKLAAHFKKEQIAQKLNLHNLRMQNNAKMVELQNIQRAQIEQNKKQYQQLFLQQLYQQQMKHPELNYMIPSPMFDLKARENASTQINQRKIIEIPQYQKQPELTVSCSPQQQFANSSIGKALQTNGTISSTLPLMQQSPRLTSPVSPLPLQTKPPTPNRSLQKQPLPAQAQQIRKNQYATQNETTVTPPLNANVEKGSFTSRNLDQYSKAILDQSVQSVSNINISTQQQSSIEKITDLGSTFITASSSNPRPASETPKVPAITESTASSKSSITIDTLTKDTPNENEKSGPRASTVSKTSPMKGAIGSSEMISTPVPISPASKNKLAQMISEQERAVNEITTSKYNDKVSKPISTPPFMSISSPVVPGSIAAYKDKLVHQTEQPSTVAAAKQTLTVSQPAKGVTSSKNDQPSTITGKSSSADNTSQLESPRREKIKSPTQPTLRMSPGRSPKSLEPPSVRSLSSPISRSPRPIYGDALPNLITWSKIVNEFYAGTSSGMTSKMKRQMNEGTEAFLYKMFGNAFKVKCAMLQGKKEVYGVPEDLKDDFMDFIDKYLDEIEEKEKKEKRKRKHPSGIITENMYLTKKLKSYKEVSSSESEDGGMDSDVHLTLQNLFSDDEKSNSMLKQLSNDRRSLSVKKKYEDHNSPSSAKASLETSSKRSNRDTPNKAGDVQVNPVNALNKTTPSSVKPTGTKTVPPANKVVKLSVANESSIAGVDSVSKTVSPQQNETNSSGNEKMPTVKYTSKTTSNDTINNKEKAMTNTTTATYNVSKGTSKTIDTSTLTPIKLALKTIDVNSYWDLMRFGHFIRHLTPQYHQLPEEIKKEIKKKVRKTLKEELDQLFIDKCAEISAENRTFGIPIVLIPALVTQLPPLLKSKFPTLEVIENADIPID